MAYRKNVFSSNPKGAESIMTNKADYKTPRKVVSGLKLSAIAAAALATSSNLAALGLGSLDVQSNLDQPLNGIIELRVAQGDDVNSLEASIASTEDFASLGIDYPAYMQNIKLTVEDIGGIKLLRVDSSDIIINEPFIHFLVRVNWAGGSFLREYTALIDPPVYAAETPRSLAEPRVVGTDEAYQLEESANIEVEGIDSSPDETEVIDQISDAEPIYEDEVDDEMVEDYADETAEDVIDEAEEYLEEEGVAADDAIEDLEQELEEDVAEEDATEVAELGDNETDSIDEQPASGLSDEQFPTDARYGPVSAGESLSVIAAELQRQFPELSVYQIMRVLFDENRSAFLRDNINGLMQGAILNLGDLSAIRAVDVDQAKAFFTEQVSEWDPSALLSSNVDSGDDLRVGQDEYAFDDSSFDEASDSQFDSSETEDTFQVGASTDSQSFVSATEGDNREGEVIILQQQITDLESALSSSSLEKQELSERISMLEGQLADMNSLLSLDVEDAEMASIESALAEQNNADAAVAIDDDLAVDETSLTDDILAEVNEDNLVDQVDSLLDDDSFSDDDSLLGDDSLLDDDLLIEDGAAIDLESTGEELVETFDESSGLADQSFGIDDPSLMDGSVDELLDDSYEDTTELVDDSLTAALNDESATDEAVVAEASFSDGPSIIEKIKTAVIDGGLWKIIAGVIGVLLAGMAAITFRRRRADEEFEISMLSIETQSQSVASSRNSSSQSSSESERETSFLTVYSDSDAVVQADEVDPIAEADVYIAYGRDEQAEEVLLDGTASKPTRIDIKQKLLSLYHKNNNVEGFERIAEELYSQKSSLTADIWQQVSLMGKDIAPNNPLFAVSAAELLAGGDVPAEIAETAVTDSVKLHNDADEVTLADPEDEMNLAGFEDDESINLINFDDERSEVSELDKVDLAALNLNDDGDEEIAGDYRDDFNGTNLDKGVGNDKAEYDKSDEILVTVLADDVLDEDVELDDVLDLSGEDSLGSSSKDFEIEEDNSDILDFGAEDSSSDNDSTDTEIQILDSTSMTHEVSGLEIDDQYNEAKTQFELAKVFVDLGDQEGARKILDDIIAAGDDNDDVVEDAIELLDSLDS